MICLDSDFIIDLLNHKQDAVLKFQSLKGEEIVSTEVNYFEILYGIFIKKQISKAELELAEQFFESLALMPLDHRSSYNAAKVSTSLAKEGLIIELNDSLIAGICISNNCKILTKNVRHFSRVKGLKIETY